MDDFDDRPIVSLKRYLKALGTIFSLAVAFFLLLQCGDE